MLRLQMPSNDVASSVQGRGGRWRAGGSASGEAAKETWAGLVFSGATQYQQRTLVDQAAVGEVALSVERRERRGRV